MAGGKVEMAKLVEEPKIEGADLDDWKKLLYRTSLQAGGFMLLNLENLNTTGVPRILQGSRLQINHALYLVEATESISGSPVTNTVNYIYAVPSSDGKTASFMYRTDPPTFNQVLGGWMRGSTEERAVAKTIPRSGNTFWNKVILDTQSAMSNFNPNTLPTSGGTLLYEANLDEFTVKVLEPGAYYLEVKGGRGGNGGDGGDFTGVGITQVGEAGEAGKQGDSVTVAFFINQHSVATLYRGNDGANGSKGTNSSSYYSSDYGAGGGSGKNGKPSYIHIENIGFVPALGGQAGKGGGGKIRDGAFQDNGAAAPQKNIITCWNMLREILTSNNGINGGTGSNGSGGTPAGGLGATTFLTTSSANSGYARIYKL
jgi:hypothetical protein